MKTRMTLYVTMTVFLITLAAGAFAQDMPGAGDGNGPLHDDPIMAGPGEPMGGQPGEFGPQGDLGPGQQAGPRPPGGPHGGRGLLFCNRHLYYSGDELSATVCLPPGVQDLLIENDTLELYLLLFSDGELLPEIPLASLGVDFTEEDPCQEILYTQLGDTPETGFQLALVLVDEATGTATDVGNWYDGLRGLLGVCGMRLNPENAPEDTNRDGFMDGNQAGIGGAVIP